MMNLGEWRPVDDGERIMCQGDEECWSGVEIIDRTLFAYEDVSDLSQGIIEIELPIGYSFCKLVRVSDLTTPKPLWDRAESWAQWWAVDPNGFVWWYEVEPILSLTIDYSGWRPATIEGRQVGKFAEGGEVEIPLGMDWRLLKERRT